MFGLVGYNFVRDGNALDPIPTAINGINSVTIENAIYDHIRLSRDVTSAYSDAIPSSWDFFTILDCNFNGTISGGNIDLLLTQLDTIALKRRIPGTFDWTTLKRVPITQTSDLSFTYCDNLAADNQEYEYALVPSLAYIEGEYITQSVLSKFNGVFVCDASSIYKFYAGVQFGAQSIANKASVYEPLSSKYPIVVTNGALEYLRASFTGTVVSPAEMDSRVLDSVANLKYRNELYSFLNNKKAKIIKDWNGNLWLVMVVDNLTATPNNMIGGQLSTVMFNFVEIGDGSSSSDLHKSGVVTASQVARG